MVGWEISSSVVIMLCKKKKVDTPKAMPNLANNLEALACNVCPSLTSQTQPLPEGSGELCIQVVSHWIAISWMTYNYSALLKYLCSVHTSLEDVL